MYQIDFIEYDPMGSKAEHLFSTAQLILIEHVYLWGKPIGGIEVQSQYSQCPFSFQIWLNIIWDSPDVAIDPVIFQDIFI